MGKSRIFLIGLVAFLLGISAANWLTFPIWAWFFVSLLLIGILLLFDERLIKAIALWALFFVFGFAYPEILGREQLVSFSAEHPIVQALVHIRNQYNQAITSVFPEPFGSFAQGLTIGERSQLPASLKQQFIQTGTLHIIAVSGFNFTILLKIFFDSIRGFGARRSFILGTFAIIGFSIITGGQDSVVRAGIMGWLFLLATVAGRVANVIIALALTCAAMALVEPSVVTQSVSFQLSVLSMLGLIWVEPICKHALERWGWQRALPKFFRDGLTATLGAQVMTLGLVLAIFGRVSFISPLVNMVIAPLVPLGMLSSLAAGVAAMLWQPLGVIIGYPAMLFLTAILTIIKTFSRVPLGAHRFSLWPWWWAVGYYAIILFLIWWFYEKKKPKGA